MRIVSTETWSAATVAVIVADPGTVSQTQLRAVCRDLQVERFCRSAES
jgi:hypothetical protein